MSDNQNGEPKQTRYLTDPEPSAPMPRRVTGPLDEVLPWVLEFRVVGTASTIQIRVSEVMTIGRGDPERGIMPDVDLGPHGGHVKGVSRNHAMITTKDNSITVSDVGSANGTRLNGYKLKANTPSLLRHGDELTFGQLSVQVLFAVVPLAISDTTLNVEDSRPTAIPEIGNNQHVLIVEDDSDVASVFGMILEQAGFRITLASTGASAIKAFGQDKPDAVILDLMLPDMDGLDLVNYVRGVEQPGTHIAVIVISGATGGFQMNKAMEAGADLFLGKPVGVDELVEAFVQLIPQMINQPS